LKYSVIQILRSIPSGDKKLRDLLHRVVSSEAIAKQGITDLDRFYLSSLRGIGEAANTLADQSTPDMYKK